MATGLPKNFFPRIIINFFSTLKLESWTFRIQLKTSLEKSFEAAFYDVNFFLLFSFVS